MVLTFFDILFFVCLLLCISYFLRIRDKSKIIEYLLLSATLTSLFFFLLSNMIGVSFVLNPAVIATGLFIGFFIPGLSRLYTEASRKIINKETIEMIMKSPAIVEENLTGGYYIIKVYCMSGCSPKKYKAYANTTDIETGTSVAVSYDKERRMFFINPME